MLAGAFASKAASTSGRAPIELGVIGDASRFDGQTGQHSTTRLVYVAWTQGATFGSPFADLFATMLDKPMLSLTTNRAGGSGEQLTPLQVANGAGDAYLVALNAAVHAWGKSIYIQPFSEMNQYDSLYGAYDANGSAKNAAHSTSAYRKAFARVSLIVHGTATPGALKALGLPPVKGRLFPNTLVKVVWSPLPGGTPDIPKNNFKEYYPGDRYVDVVGLDLFDAKFHVPWDDVEDLYRLRANKPFAITAVGIWSIDDPAFVTKLAGWVRSHGRAMMLVYYSGKPGSIFDLAKKPKSLAAYRKLIVPLAR